MATDNKNTYQHNSNCDIDCDEYIKTECVVYNEAIPYLGLEAGASSKTIIDKLVQTVEYLQTQLNTIQLPTVPTNLISSSITATTVDLSWTFSIDNIGVVSYNIYKDSVLQGNTGTTSTSITGLITATSYSFTITALDAAGNESTASVPLIVTTI